MPPIAVEIEMQLDLRSLYMMSMLVALALGCITIFFGSKDRQYRPIRDWGASTLLIAVAMALLMTRGDVISLVSQVLADTLLLSGATLAYRSLRLHRGEPTRDAVGWTVVAVVAGILALRDAGIALESVRSGMVTVVLAAMMWRIAWLVGRRLLPEAQTAQRFTAIVYLLFGAVFLLRSIGTYLRPARDFSLMAGSPVEAFMIGAVTILWMSATLGVMWMALGRQQAALVQLATRDPLTGALNRHALEAEFERERYRADRARDSFGVAMFDIDHFKPFNDTYGHQTGDDVLCALVAKLRTVTRKNDLVGRYGGEEFLLLMPGASLTVTQCVAERARSSIEEGGYVAGGKRVSLTVSAGVSVYPVHGTDWHALVGAADAALYLAKRGGRNQVVMADPQPAAEPAPAGAA